jgi:hypothetical protein
MALQLAQAQLDFLKERRAREVELILDARSEAGEDYE